MVSVAEIAVVTETASRGPGMIATWKDVYLGPLTAINDGVRPGVRPSVRPDVRPDVWAARVSSAAPKKKSCDRGGPVSPPRSNVTNDCLKGGSGGEKNRK